MKPDPFEPPLSQKPARPTKPDGFPYLRCCVFVLVGGVAVCAGCCGIGNYVFFHTSVPLAYLEQAMEKSGDVEIEGMTGTVSNGFHVDQLRVRNESGNWNELKEVDFRFNGVYELVMKNRLIIQQFTVGSGEFYYQPIDSSPAGKDAKMNDAAGGDKQDADAFDEMPRPSRSRSGDSGINEFRVDLFRLSNLKFINRETNVEFKIDEVSIKGFQILNDQLVNLGDITVESDHVEFHTKPSDRFDDQPQELIKRKFTGVVRASASDRILKDVSYEVDVCFAQNGDVLMDADFFGDKVNYVVRPNEDNSVSWRDFSPQDYLKWDEGVVPSHLSGGVSFSPTNSNAGNLKYAIAPDSKFQLGETEFTIETTELAYDTKTKRMPPITSVAKVGERQIHCQIHVLRTNPFLAISLQSNDENNTPELFSKTVYAKDLSELTGEQKSLIDEMIKASSNVESVTDVSEKTLPRDENSPDVKPTDEGASATTNP